MLNYNINGNLQNNDENLEKENYSDRCRRPCHEKCCHCHCHCHCRCHWHDECNRSDDKCSIRKLENLVEQYEEKNTIADQEFNTALSDLYKAIAHFDKGFNNVEEGNVIGLKILHWLKECMCYCDDHKKHECEELKERIINLIKMIIHLNKESYEYTIKAAEKLAQSRELDEELEELKEEFARCCMPHKDYCQY